MNENDLRDCFAMFAMMGILSRGQAFNAEDAWRVADRMLETRNQPDEELGIAALKPKRKYARKEI